MVESDYTLILVEKLKIKIIDKYDFLLSVKEEGSDFTLLLDLIKPLKYKEIPTSSNVKLYELLIYYVKQLKIINNLLSEIWKSDRVPWIRIPNSEEIDKATIEITNSLNIDKETVDYIYECFIKNSDLIELLAAYYQNVINICTKTNRELMFYVLYLVEKCKDYILKISDKKKIKYPVYKFGMIPVTNSISLSEISVKLFGIEYKGTIEKFALSKGIGILLIKNQYIEVFESSVLNLIDKEVTDKFITLNGSAPTEKLINQYKTLIKHDNNNKSVFSYEIINDSDTYIVLESIEVNKYRILLPWHDINKFLIKKERIKKILESIDETQRFIKYQYHLQNSILENMFTTKQIDRESFETVLDSVQVSTIYLELFTNIEKLKNKLKLDAYDFLHSDELQDCIIDTMINIYKLPVYDNRIKLYKNNIYKVGELYSTFFMQLNSLVSRIMRNIHEFYLKNKDHDEIKIIKYIINNSITDKDNIFTDIVLKHNLLSMSDDHTNETLNLYHNTAS